MSYAVCPRWVSNRRHSFSNNGFVSSLHCVQQFVHVMCAFEQIIQQRFHLTFLVFNEDFHSMSCLHRPFNKGFVSFNKDVLFCTEQPLKVSYHFFFCTKQPSKVSYHSTKMSSFARSNQERLHVIIQRCPFFALSNQERLHIIPQRCPFFAQTIQQRFHIIPQRCPFFARSNQERFQIIQQRCPFLRRPFNKGFISFHKGVLFLH